MNYSETIDWLFQQFPAYHLLGQQAYNPGLKNTEELADFFGNPQQKLRFVHVGGTNGKGSTSNMLASILTESGEKVGLFTSPHLFDFTERIRINGQPVDSAFVIAFCEKVRTHKWTIQPSFFEITWMMALSYFESKKCSIVIAEVGLGGRLDNQHHYTCSNYHYKYWARSHASFGRYESSHRTRKSWNYQKRDSCYYWRTR